MSPTKPPAPAARSGTGSSFTALVKGMRSLFRSKSPLRQAAALPWREKGSAIQVLLVTTRGSGRWMLPKGWAKRGETLADAASREAFEEAGVSGSVSSAAIGHYTHRSPRRASPAQDRNVEIYPLRVEQTAGQWPEQNERRRRWFLLPDAASRVGDPELAKILRRFSPPEGEADRLKP